MQNIQKTREMMGQIGAACVEIVRGCELAQSQPIDVDSLDELVLALGELHKNAQKLRENAMSSINPALDHDGKTEPANEVPADPVCKCGHKKTDHMPEGPFLHALCIHCECEGFEEWSEVERLRSHPAHPLNK